MVSSFLVTLPTGYPTSPIVPIPIVVPNKSVAHVHLSGSGLVGGADLNDINGWPVPPTNVLPADLEVDFHSDDILYAKTFDNGGTGILHVLMFVS